MTLQKLIASFVLCVLMMPTAGLSADLSPGKWNPEEKAHAEQGEKIPWPPKAQVVEGKSGLVAGTMSPIAVLAGVETLREVIALSGVAPGGQPTLAIATIGVSLLPETVRLLVGVLANHLDPLTAMAAPPMLLNFEPAKPGEKAGSRPDLIPADAYSPEFLKSLADSGFRVETKSKFEVFAVKGTAVMGVIDPETGTLRSVEKPEIFGFATAF